MPLPQEGKELLRRLLLRPRGEGRPCAVFFVCLFVWKKKKKRKKEREECMRVREKEKEACRRVAGRRKKKKARTRRTPPPPTDSVSFSSSRHFVPSSEITIPLRKNTEARTIDSGVRLALLNDAFAGKILGKMGFALRAATTPAAALFVHRPTTLIDDD